MMNDKKNFIKLLATAICIGFLGGFLKLWYEKNFGTIPAIAYVALIVLVFLLLFVITTVPVMNLKKKIVRLNKVLHEEHDTKTYLTQMMVIQNKKKGLFDFQYDKNKLVIDINVAIGFMAEGRFDKAVKLMKNVDVTGIHPFTKGTFYGNYVYSLFRIKKNNEALNMLENHRDLFEKFQDVPNIGAYICLDLAQEASINKNQEDVTYYLTKAEGLAQGHYEQQEYIKIAKILKGQ